MSQISNSPDSLQQVIQNSYFEGKVKSLGLDTEKGYATVGVMKKGNYQFSTSKKETIIVISGVMGIKLKDGEWKKHQKQETIEIAAGVTFDVVCDMDVAYICYYK